MKKITAAKSLLGATLALAACESLPADSIRNDIAGRDRLGQAANLILSKMDLRHPVGGVQVDMTGTFVESPFEKDNAPWLKQKGTVESRYGGCAITFVGRQNPDGTFAGWGFNGNIRVPLISQLEVTTSRGSVRFEVGDPDAYDGGEPSLTVNGETYRPTPSGGEGQLTDNKLGSATDLAYSVLRLCGAIPTDLK